MDGRGRLHPKTGPRSTLRSRRYPSTRANRPFMFPTALLRELSHVMLIELFEDVEEAWGRRGSFGEHLVWIFETAAERAEEKGPRARELLSAMMSLAFPQTAEADDQRMRAMFRKLLEDGRASGEVRVDEDVETLTEVFVGTWYSIFLSWVHSEGYPLRERAAATARFLSRILTAPA